MVYPKTVIQISESLARCEIKLGELASRGRSIQAGSLCYTNGCAVDAGCPIGRPFSTSSSEDRGVFFTIGTKALVWHDYVLWTLDTGWKPMLH